MARTFTDPLSIAFRQPRPITFVAIDPSLGRTGICVLRTAAVWDLDRLKTVGDREVRALLSDRHRDAEGGFQRLQQQLTLILATEEWFVPVLEWPPPKTVGGKNTSHEAAASWRQWLFTLARDRWITANPGKTKAPDAERALLDPYPQQWRGPIGITTKGIGTTENERAAYIKRQSMAYAWRELGARWRGPEALERVNEEDELLDVAPIHPHEGWGDESPARLQVNSDISEAVCIGTWAIRNVGTIGTWLREDGKPKLLRALI